MTEFSGGCLCGAVRYEGSEQKGGGHCHCIDCRKSSGTGHCSHMVVPEDSFDVTGGVRFYDKPADSGNMVSRGFCPTCGSPVYSRNSGIPGVVFVRASSLDDPDVFQPQMVVYAKRDVKLGSIDPTLPTFEEMAPPEEVKKALS